MKGLPKIRQRFLPRLRGKYRHVCCEHTRAGILFWQCVEKHGSYLVAADSSGAVCWEFDYKKWSFEPYRNKVKSSNCKVKS
jgi:hypothetical protein